MRSRSESSISIAEVAKAAGVSTATVSRVLNNFPGVRSQTVEQVKTAVETLNYQPQRPRQASKFGNYSSGKAVGRTGNIAAITCGGTDEWLKMPVITDVLSGMQRGAGEFGLRLLLEEVPVPSKASPLLEIQGRNIDGAIIFVAGSLPVQAYDHILRPLAERVPIVWGMGMENSAGGVDHVLPDNIRVGCIAWEYLHSHNCRHLAFITTDPQWDFIRLRGQAFLNSAFDAGNPASAYLVGDRAHITDCYGPSAIMTSTLEQAVARLAASNPRPTGIFVGCDRTTVQLYPLLAQHGIEVGRDVTLISCDNEEIRLSSLHPRPASIDIGCEEVGFCAVVRLVVRMQHPQDKGPIVMQVSPHLVLPDQSPQGATA